MYGGREGYAGTADAQTTGQGRCEGSCCCSKGYKWFMQIFTWFAVAYMIAAIVIASYSGGILLISGIIVFGVFYVIYTIMACCSNTCAYLKNIKGGGGVCDYMERLFYQPGLFCLYAECYHYVYSYTRRGGRSRRKVTTYTESRTFPYKSWRDISGPFNLDTSGVNMESKSLLKLKLVKSIELAQDGTYEDYAYFRDSMIYRLQYVDQCFNIIESNFIPGFQDKTLVQLGDEIPCMASPGCFAMCVIVMLGEFYKLCFNSHCSFQEFHVRKLCSSQQDLNANINSPQYLEQAPQIILKGQTFKFFDTAKYAPPPQGLDTPQDQIRQDVAMRQGGGDPNDMENNFQLTSAPIRGQSQFGVGYGQLSNVQPQQMNNQQMGNQQMGNQQMGNQQMGTPMGNQQMYNQGAPQMANSQMYGNSQQQVQMSNMGNQQMYNNNQQMNMQQGYNNQGMNSPQKMNMNQGVTPVNFNNQANVNYGFNPSINVITLLKFR